MSILSKVLGKVDSLVQYFNQSLEMLENEVCRYEGSCPHKRNLPRSIPPYNYGIGASSESLHQNIVYVDVCMKGIGKYCEGPKEEPDINFLLETEEKMVEF